MRQHATERRYSARVTTTPTFAFDSIVKAYDIRGLYPEQINADCCRALGTGFAAFIAEVEPSSTTVVIARDMRPSGPELVDAFADGVLSQGLDVIDVGLGSTDLLYYASGSLNLPGVMFTASHNPAEYNGIKLCRAGAAPIGEETGLSDIKRNALAGLEPKAERGSRSSQDLLADFATHVLSFMDRSELRPLKVVADTANGMGGLVVPAVFDQLPFDLEIMYPELDGTFPNHEANPIQVENLQDLQKRVLEVGADIGLAFDGDADRVFPCRRAGRAGVRFADHGSARRGRLGSDAGLECDLQPHLFEEPCPRSSPRTVATPFVRELAIRSSNR